MKLSTIDKKIVKSVYHWSAVSFPCDFSPRFWGGHVIQVSTMSLSIHWWIFESRSLLKTLVTASQLPASLSLSELESESGWKSLSPPSLLSFLFSSIVSTEYSECWHFKWVGVSACAWLLASKSASSLSMVMHNPSRCDECVTHTSPLWHPHKLETWVPYFTTQL